MSDIYGDAPIKYLEQTPQRMRERIADLERQVAALKAELTTMEQLYGSEFNLNNNLIAVRAALTKENERLQTACNKFSESEILEGNQLAAVVQQRDDLLAALDVLRDRVIDEYDRIYISGVIGKVKP